MSITDLLYQREALKIEILADRPKIMVFIKNSYQLWFASQFARKTALDAFYGTGWIHDVLGRQLARKECMAAWRKAKETHNTMDLVPHVATVLNYTKDIARNVRDVIVAPTPYDALVQMQTPGFINPLRAKDLKMLHKIVKDKQTDSVERLHPEVPIEVQNRIIKKMISIAGLDTDSKVEVIYDTAHPACLGYGGVPMGVKLGVTHDPNMTPFKSLITNWHEIGHAAYRQNIPYGKFVAGRAMDEAIAFLFEYWIGYSEEFLQFLLDEGLADCGYDMGMLKSNASEIVRDTKRIETNPIRHIIDIELCEQLERALLNDKIEGEDCEVFWAAITAPYRDILPDDYPYYYDVHMMSGIYGDRACYTPGLLAAMQIGYSKNVTLGNLCDVVQSIAHSGHSKFNEAIMDITHAPLNQNAFMAWMQNIYQIRLRPLGFEGSNLEVL